jgi:uncharacterized protein YndB with AHSA1/START domain
MTDTRITHELEANPVAASVTEEDGRWVLTMQRRLRHSPERVWPMLTEPDRLSRWSPFVPDRALDSLGPATARETPDAEPHDAEVLVLDPPRELVHRWGDDRMRWTLQPDGEGTLLTLEHGFAERPDAGMFAAGWHICFGTLAALEESDADSPVNRVIGEDATAYGWETLRDAYDELLAD